MEVIYNGGSLNIPKFVFKMQHKEVGKQQQSSIDHMNKDLNRLTLVTALLRHVINEKK